MKSKDQPFCFFDNREKYLLFVTTTSEKEVTAEHVGREFDWISLSQRQKTFSNVTVVSLVSRRVVCGGKGCHTPSSTPVARNSIHRLTVPRPEAFYLVEANQAPSRDRAIRPKSM